jgi:hypothetical protein|tara:strand:- start:254 stop:577 length:324 start_codon:yes stop_codon:yes gene_type:complete
MAGGGSFTSDQSSTRIASTGQVKTVSGGSTNLGPCRVTYIQAKGSGAFATDASVILRDSVGTGGKILFEGHFKQEGLDIYLPGSGIRFKTAVHATMSNTGSVTLVYT